VLNNFYFLDWGPGAQGTSRPEAVGNIRMAAKIISLLIEKLVEEKHADLSNMHLTGHSLGAQLVCYIAKNFKGKIKWIYALDPTGPDFNDHPEQVC